MAAEENDIKTLSERLITVCSQGSPLDDEEQVEAEQIEVMVGIIDPVELNKLQDKKDIVNIGKLLEAGASINYIDNRGYTALRSAILRRRIEIVRHLLLNNADVNQESVIINANKEIVEQERIVALDLACSLAEKEIVQLLIDHKALVNHVNALEETPLTCAVQTSSVPVAELLISHKADVHFIDNYQWSLLTHCLSSYNSPQIRTYTMISENSRPYVAGWANLKILETDQAMDGADLEEFYLEKTEKTKSMIQFLAKQGLDLNHIPYEILNKQPQPRTTFDGHSPLMLACRAGSKEIIQCLLMLKADINLTSRNVLNPFSRNESLEGAGALFMAAAAGYFDCVRYLVHLGAHKNQVATCIDQKLQNERKGQLDHPGQANLPTKHWTVFRVVLHHFLNSFTENDYQESSQLDDFIDHDLHAMDFIVDFDPDDAPLLKQFEEVHKKAAREWMVGRYNKLIAMMNLFQFMQGQNSVVGQTLPSNFLKFPDRNEYLNYIFCSSRYASFMQKTFGDLDTPLHLACKLGQIDNLKDILYGIKTQYTHLEKNCKFESEKNGIAASYLLNILRLQNKAGHTVFDCAAHLPTQGNASSNGNAKSHGNAKSTTKVVSLDEIRELQKKELHQALASVLKSELIKLEWIFSFKWGHTTQIIARSLPSQMLNEIIKYYGGSLAYTLLGKRFENALITQIRELAFGKSNYEKGLHFLNDKGQVNKAMICFYRASKQGHELALHQLALCHLHDERDNPNNRYKPSPQLAVIILKKMIGVIEQNKSMKELKELTELKGFAPSPFDLPKGDVDNALSHAYYLLGAIYLHGSQSFLNRPGVEKNRKWATQYLKAFNEIIEGRRWWPTHDRNRLDFLNYDQATQARYAYENDLCHNEKPRVLIFSPMACYQQVSPLRPANSQESSQQENPQQVSPQTTGTSENNNVKSACCVLM